jgi:hypothetical protein
MGLSTIRWLYLCRAVGRVMAEIGFGYDEHFITTRGYFDSIGGASEFLKQWGDGGQIVYFQEVKSISKNFTCSSGFNSLIDQRVSPQLQFWGYTYYEVAP